MKTNTEYLRAFYLKGVTIGNEALIEITEDLGSREADESYIKVAKAGEKYPAILHSDHWEVRINNHIKRTTHMKDIPLSQGRIR